MLGTSSLVRLCNSLSFRLQLLAVVLSMVGIVFGIRDYVHINEQFGAEKGTIFFNDLLTQMAIAAIFNIFAALIIYRIATKPIRILCEIMRGLARGTLDVSIPYADQGNEIGSMARKVLVFKQNAIDKRDLEEQQRRQAAQKEELEKRRLMETLANDLEVAILSIVEIVASAAEDLKVNAKNLSSIAEKTSQQSISVTNATQETSVSVQTVTTTIEELSRSINAINRQVSHSADISREAVAEVKNADATISSLSDAAAQIGDVIRLIQDIARQTNLLALNATIEAARAGAAGKGFSVVANEVKNLASQTAQATEEIAKKITTMQKVSTDSVTAIRGIGKTIDQTNEIAAGISSATQQQTHSAEEISRNVHLASSGTDKIAFNIALMTKEAQEARGAADEVLQDSHKLFQQSARLKSEIQLFVEKIRQTT